MKKKRVTFTLDESTYQLLKRVSTRLNFPMSTLVEDMLREALPILDKEADTKTLLADYMQKVGESFEDIANELRKKM